MKERMLDINPNIVVNTYPVFLDDTNIESFNLSQYDYVVDAIDSVTSKILLIEYCVKDVLELKIMVIIKL